jgi:GTP-binding protein HflX
MERALRFYDEKLVRQDEKCYLVGLEDKSQSQVQSGAGAFTMEESLTELSELAGAAGLTVVGSTYQRVSKPSIEYYIGLGKTKDISKAMSRNKCTCVIFDTELTPSQQKNLEIAFNTEKKGNEDKIKVVDRTALILDIFAQHARTKEGQLQVQLALLTYRLPRLTNMWSHLERQSAGARGKSNGGVGLRGPGEKQLESDKRQMRAKISLLNRAIDNVRRHRSQHRSRRKRLGVPVVALVGYTNAGKSTLLNSLIGEAGGNKVFVADMLFATLDPTTRRVPGTASCPDILLTDTVGFIQKLPTNLVAAFRATLEEIAEADVLLHVADISNDAWRKQEAAVLRELTDMGLDDKPVITLWNKVDLVPERKEFLKFEAKKRGQTVAVSASTGEGMDQLKAVLQETLSAQMEPIALTLSGHEASFGGAGGEGELSSSSSGGGGEDWRGLFQEEEGGLQSRRDSLISAMHDLGVIEEVHYGDDGVYVRGLVPTFLREQIDSFLKAGGGGGNGQGQEEEVDWKSLAKGRHTAVQKWSMLADRERDRREEQHLAQEWALPSAADDEADILQSQGLSAEGLLDFDNGEFAL